MINETYFAIPPNLRAASKLDLGDATCYFYDVEHPNSGGTNLMHIFNNALNEFKWDKYILPGSTVVDIGAHAGDTTVAMQVISRGVVLGIEPNSTMKPYLDYNCHVNTHLGKFITAGEAVTTADVDEVVILDHSNGLCNGGMVDPSWSPELQQRMRAMAGQSVTAPGMTLEHLCQKYLTEEEINNISFIKSDTEGHDVSIIDSSREFIDRLKPVLFIEWFFAFTEVEDRNMFKVIDEIGYKAFNPYTLQPADISSKGVSDLLLIHNSQVSKYL